jgi:hypothetical protein
MIGGLRERLGALEGTLRPRSGQASRGGRDVASYVSTTIFVVLSGAARASVTILAYVLSLG